MTGASRRALVAGVTSRIGDAVARRLRADGFTVVTDPPPPGTDPPPPGTEPAGAAAAHALDLAVYARVEPESLTPRRLVEVDEATWARACEDPIRDFLEWLQRVHMSVAAASGIVVLVAPTLSQEGAAGLVPYATAVEGQRLLAKSAARRWGSDGVTVLVVAPRVDALVADPSVLDATDARRTEPALTPRSFDPEAVAEVVALMSAPGARLMSGATLPVDGAALMAP